jgi:hypothetical protein
MVLPERRVCEYEIAITACAIRTCTLGWFSSPEIGNPTRRQLVHGGCGKAAILAGAALQRVRENRNSAGAVEQRLPVPAAERRKNAAHGASRG